MSNNKSSNKTSQKQTDKQASSSSSAQNFSSSKQTASMNATPAAEPAIAASATTATNKARLGVRMCNRYALALGSVMLVLLASRISIPGHSSEDKDETISVGESDVTAVYRDDPFGARVPVDSIVVILQHVGLFFDRTLDPEISLVSWVFNREAGKLNRSLTEIATKMKQDWTGSIVKSEMMEKTRAVLDTLIATIDVESIDNLHYSHNTNISPKALANELKLLIQIISETLTGNQKSEQQTPSLRTANYIDYMKIKVDRALLPDIIKEYLVLFKRIGFEKVIIGLKELLREWRKEFKPE